MGKVLAVGLYRILVGGGGAEVAGPVGGAGQRSLGDDVVEIGIDAADHLGGEVSRLGEGLGAWEDGRGGFGA